MGSSRGVNSGRELSSLQSEDAHLLGMEYFGLFDPFGDSGGDRRHGENHGGELLVKSKRKLVNEGNIVGDTCLGSEGLEVSDVFLEYIIHDAIRAFERFLGELGELKTDGCFDIIGEKCGFEIGREFVKGLF